MSKQISNNEFDSLDEFFSDKLKDASMQPPERVWEQIEGSLNNDGKRKRRFFWLFFCGLIFMGSSLSTYFFLLDSKNETTVKTTQVKNESINTKITSTEIITSKENKTQITETQYTNTEKNIVKEEKLMLVKIQLGAFKNQINPSVFAKTGLDIKSETAENGITKYYAEVAESEVQQALQQIKQNGFTDAFIKRNTLLASKDNVIENKPVASQPKTKPVLALVQNTTYESREPVLPQPTNSNKVIIAASKLQTTQQNNNTPSPVNEELIFTNNTPQQNQIKDNSAIKNDVANTITTNSVANSPPQNQGISVKDSLQKDTTEQPVVIANKKDTVIAKTDSVKSLVKTDNSIKEPILNRWALLLTGGPNFFIKNSHNNLFDNSGEKQPITYNTSFKVEYKLLKKIAISAGLSYSYFTAQQDATLFYFPKNLTSDFIFYSSYGPMAVDKNTMLQGYSLQAPTTMFHANYSYTSKINTLLIPIEAKWYYVNGKKINLYAALGTSALLVLSEQTKLSVIKEHFNNDLSYNQINTTKFNALLMLGLGGDIKLYKQLYFTVDGGFRYGTTNLSNTSGIKTNPTYFSASGGLKIKL